jgi:lincosamide and streptogramin A transport system ATP-binding/permease protein
VPNLICRRLSFAYDGAERPVFTDLDLIIDTGWRAALVGGNGRGKTTLLKLLAGELLPDAGEVERGATCLLFGESTVEPDDTAWAVAKDMAGPFRAWEVEIDALLARGDEPALARYGGIESEYRARGGYEIDARLARELDELAVPERLRQRPVGTLSGGERTRCRLAGLFAAEGAFPLIDEPTNHLDLSGRRLVAGYLAAKPGFLLVSHDRSLLDVAAEHVIALNPDTVETHRLRYSDWRRAMQGRLAEQVRANALLRKDIRRLETAADARRAGAAAREADKTAGGRRRQPSERGVDRGFIGARAARQMKRALAAERRAARAADERRKTLTDLESVYELKLATPPDPVGSTVPLVRATNVTVARGSPLFAPLSFRVDVGERLAVLGANGAGKSSLLDAIAGELPTSSGELSRPAQVRISRVCQQPRWRTGHLRTHLEAAGLDEGRFRQIMAALGVRGAVLDQRLEQLSQGQLKKVELARSVIEPAHVLLWDEPLNWIDVDARERIEEALLAASVSMIFVEHDARFVERLATRRIVLEVSAARP